jgi:hypothetical protein
VLSRMPSTHSRGDKILRTEHGHFRLSLWGSYREARRIQSECRNRDAMRGRFEKRRNCPPFDSDRITQCKQRRCVSMV